ncbi:major facilitator superfamily domain-containing protein [Mycena albidolilacea]|uniref:Major facilitator superfamily domain-containing protein n=1 Tax=Mycena albidolilacea TaxID=1033008 RepID=A0AAD7APH2_9AGAR|nr:major facilitator superfamily domain-containing protein [Mycena albidolilacea]
MASDSTASATASQAPPSPREENLPQKAYAPTVVSPHDWPARKKWANVILISAQATLSPVCSTFLAVGAQQADIDLHVTSPVVGGLPVAVFVLGLGLGPLYLAPLSEMFGRRIVYVVSFGLFALLNMGCALVQTDSGLIILRLLAGLAGSAGPSLGGGSIGDMFTREQRGGAQALYGFGPTFGPALGGIIGGYVAERAGWRWLMWTMAIAAATTTLLSVLFLHETYKPYLDARADGKRSAPTTIGFRKGITRPIRMFFFSPIVTAMSLYMALIYGVLYLHFVTIPLLFGPRSIHGLFTYGWKNGNEGLAYLGAGLGCYVSTVFCLFTLNRSYRALAKKYGYQKPEFRMLFMQIGMIFVPAGLFIYGWSAQFQTHFMVPLLGAAIFAFGMLITYICIQTYLVDAFAEYAASALAATIILRSICGAVFSIVGAKLYERLGYGWGTSVLAFISVGALPIPALFWVFGPKLREKKFLG